MKHVNLMTDAARFRTEARVYLRWWSAGIVALAAALAPIAIWRRQEAHSARAACEAMEAGYDPICRLVKLNRDLRLEAAALVKNRRLELELSRSRPMSALLKVVSAAAAESDGQLFVESLAINEHAPGDVAPPPPAGAAVGEEKLVIDAVALASYDIAGFVEALKKQPVKSVKVLSDAVFSPQGGDRKSYKVECIF
jgi:hypothetical protein